MTKNVGQSNLGALAKDRNQTAVQAGSTFTTTDATTIPQTSPTAYTTGVITLVVPNNAVECIILPTTDARVSEIADVSVYYFHAANTAQSYPCAEMQNIYFKRDAANGNLFFRFTTV